MRVENRKGHMERSLRGALHSLEKFLANDSQKIGKLLSHHKEQGSANDLNELEDRFCAAEAPDENTALLTS